MKWKAHFDLNVKVKLIDAVWNEIFPTSVLNDQI